MSDNFFVYGPEFQHKIIASLYTDRVFLQQIYDILETEYFEAEATKWVVDWTLNYYTQYNSQPSLGALKAETEEIKNDLLKTKVKKTVIDIHRYLGSTDLPWVKDKSLDFCKQQKLKNAIFQSLDLVSNGEYDEIRNVVEEALKAGNNVDVGHNYKESVVERYTIEVRNTVPTGWEALDNVTGGGLSFGELGVIVAPPGIGKSWVLVNVGANAVREGKKVLHLTLELNEKYVGHRYDAVLTGIPSEKLKLHQDKVQERINKLPGDLLIKEFSTKTLSVSGLLAFVEKVKSNEGFEPDLIVIDYADLMKLNSSRAQKHEALEELYEELRGVAGQLHLPIWTASQAGREGATADIVQGDTIAGSFAKLMVADLVISLSRKLADKEANTGRFHIIKNRFGPDGITLPSKNNLSNGKIEIFDVRSKEGTSVTAEMERNSGVYKDRLRALKAVMDEEKKSG